MTKRIFKNPEETKKRMSESQKKRFLIYGAVPPYIRTDKIKEKISNSLKGRKIPEEIKEKIKKGIILAQTEEVKRKKALSHVGLKDTKETRLKKSIALKKFYINNTNYIKGKKHKPETINKMRIAREKAMKENRHFKGAFRKDLNQYFRSKFEANFARFLSWLNIKYEYETNKTIFKLNDGRTYICDFYLPEIEQYVELKGFDWKKKIQDKYEVFKKEFPKIKWNILYQKSEEWKQIVKNYSKLIDNWEFYEDRRIKCL
jgi:hypothetical protein